VNNDQLNLSDDARECLFEIINAIDCWDDRPLVSDHGTSRTRARLRGLAAAILRILDSADGRGWNVQDILYELNVGHNDEGDEDYEENDIDELLSLPKSEVAPE
jgi:hypothetical protein